MSDKGIYDMICYSAVVLKGVTHVRLHVLFFSPVLQFPMVALLVFGSLSLVVILTLVIISQQEKLV